MNHWFCNVHYFFVTNLLIGLLFQAFHHRGLLPSLVWEYLAAPRKEKHFWTINNFVLFLLHLLSSNRIDLNFLYLEFRTKQFMCNLLFSVGYWMTEIIQHLQCSFPIWGLKEENYQVKFYIDFFIHRIGCKLTSGNGTYIRTQFNYYVSFIYKQQKVRHKRGSTTTIPL